MNIWRLIAHHETANEALEQMIESNVIAIGWSDIGNLAELNPSCQNDITQAIQNCYPNLNNAHFGGPSLWGLLIEMHQGDLVIINTDSVRRVVVEVTGDYYFSPESEAVLGYHHHRPAQLTKINAEQLWKEVGSEVAKGQNIRWTLALCTKTPRSEITSLTEGRRYSVSLTAVERNPNARRECIARYGCICHVCKIDFEKHYGSELGKDYIHVHHRKDLALSEGRHKVDPIKDLIPLCPNCHAMVHKKRPAMSVENA